MDRPPGGIDITRAHQARVYDYVLGGKDNYVVDREAAEATFADYPGGLDAARRLMRENRAFLGRAVHWLAADAGVRQFLDIGTGIPTADNTHQVAQRAAPEARIVYVDKDPMVLAHARALLVGNPPGVTKYVDADLRDPDEIIQQAAEILDFNEPVAVVLVLILHMIGDHDDAYRIVGRLIDAIPSGSYLAIAHPASDIQPEDVENAANQASQRMTEQVYTRDHAEVSRFFDGLELVEPGVVQTHQWRPGSNITGTNRTIPIHCGVARKL